MSPEAYISTFTTPAHLATPGGRVIAQNPAASAIRREGRGHAVLARLPVVVCDRSLQLVLLQAGTVAIPVPPSWRLPPRLNETATLILEGLSCRSIAQRMGLTHTAARTYVRRVYSRVGVHSRFELIRRAREDMDPLMPGRD